jgi:hypothetical protein
MHIIRKDYRCQTLFLAAYYWPSLYNSQRAMALQAMVLRERIINIIKDEIDSALGAGSSRLVLRTCSLVYDLSTAEILKQPEQFEATLNKILGKKHPKKQSNQLWTDSRMKCYLSIERPRICWQGSLNSHA